MTHQTLKHSGNSNFPRIQTAQAQSTNEPITKNTPLNPITIKTKIASRIQNEPEPKLPSQHRTNISLSDGEYKTYDIFLAEIRARGGEGIAFKGERERGTRVFAVERHDCRFVVALVSRVNAPLHFNPFGSSLGFFGVVMSPLGWLVLALAAAVPSSGQRITTIQLDGVQYFVSRMNPYSPELNYFLAYQYCRSLGLQLASFETKEKADSITTYLTNAGYTKYDFWTSGNNLGTDMFLWMSTGLPFNATFNYMKRGGEISVQGAEPIPSRPSSMDPIDVPQGSTAPQRTARHGTEHVLSDGCVALKAPTFHWEPQHCGDIKDFICEQTRCYYYNYGSIPVSSAQGKPLSLTTTTTAPPITSSSPLPPRSEHLPTHFTLNDLLGKLRPSSLDGLQSPHLKTASTLVHKNPPQIDSHYSGINHHEHAQDNQEVSIEKVATLVPSTYEGDADINDNPTQQPNDPNNSVEDDGSATVGPYNHNAYLQMGDDPNAYVAPNSNNNPEDDYVSTIEPDIVTTYKSELLKKIAGKVLATPSQ